MNQIQKYSLEGDERAALGLAGLAIRAGARNILATLWQVSDRSTVKFRERFYQELGRYLRTFNYSK